MAKRYMKKECCASVIIRVIQITTTVTYLFPLVRMTVIQKTETTRELVRMWRKGDAMHPWWACNLVQPEWTRE